LGFLSWQIKKQGFVTLEAALDRALWIRLYPKDEISFALERKRGCSGWYG
jgi:hypothetical protein